MTPEQNAALEALRARIDALDRAVVASLAARRAAVAELASLKRAAGLPAVDPQRERALAERWTRAALEEGVPAKLAVAVLDVVLAHSRPHVEGLLAEGAVCAEPPRE